MKRIYAMNAPHTGLVSRDPRPNYRHPYKLENVSMSGV